MFDAKIRDKLLFEDDNYTMARRYFWAHQTLGIMNESIKALVEAYDDRFTDDVWEGRHKTLWPLLDDTSNRNKHYRKKMAGLREEFNIMLGRLRKLIEENNDRRREIQDLREDLFTGTSIQESRKSVNATETTVQQGYNIKLLTMEFFETFQALCDALRLFDSITPHRHWLILLPVILGIRDGEYAKAIHDLRHLHD
ncbi:hypothetical protein LTR09_006357 [Extremus antarcticus]|uniref:Uncharacterized protein n=1 Tax=Extremus antarcticus TaxID=702011 RepID=A0AAJ0DEE2_9PEZI|nr:hypothetical protein LTR09_006357 [Extremus antarcticus]